jgi:predicted ester cyclase
VGESETKSAVRRYFERYHNDRELTLLDEVVDPDLRERTAAAQRALEEAFPDYSIELVELVAEGDVVAAVWRGRGTHRGDWDSPIGTVSPTERAIEWDATTTVRVRDGRIVAVLGSHWDHLGMLQQMGAVDAAAPRSGA